MNKIVVMKMENAEGRAHFSRADDCNFYFVTSIFLGTFSHKF